MEKEQIFKIMNNNPAFFLATTEDGLPRVRGMLLFRADDDGIIFHTGANKDVYRQICSNPQAQLCFFDPIQNLQVRIRGTLQISQDNRLKDEIAEHPTRAFVKAWKEGGALQDFYNDFAVLVMTGGLANIWTYETNFVQKEDIAL